LPNPLTRSDSAPIVLFLRSSPRPGLRRTSRSLRGAGYEARRRDLAEVFLVVRAFAGAVRALAGAWSPAGSPAGFPAADDPFAGTDLAAAVLAGADFLAVVVREVDGLVAAGLAAAGLAAAGLVGGVDRPVARFADRFGVAAFGAASSDSDRSDSSGVGTRTVVTPDRSMRAAARWRP